METMEIQPKSRRSKSTATRSKTKKVKNGNGASDAQLRVKEAAYYKALERGFDPGHELDDWLAAEKEENQ